MLIHAKPEELLIGRRPNGDMLQVFITDDSPVMIKLLGRMLTEFGFNIVGSANNGAEAIKKITELKAANQHIDLCTLDITMPVMDGMTALPQIVALVPDATVIMVSALGDKSRVMQAVSLGARYYIVKPFQKLAVFESLYKIFSR